ncbi:hybrid sensor histidine kinase/response regulator [Sandaracinus amylolyticus]|uniref:hybrid sensor histidine kinase/response regulator n=1 Tax=Sandaracinus amylolyticus TaxID=927083 RepID=UPI001F28D1CE|nr:hybrid sensor histidine kinase/response regulator [Sandaracinus amylolyticus]UJR82361.1 Hypothetical protein I5071_44260 [Sandaracinus amylolyticus]
MTTRPLALAIRAAIADELTSALRHDLRNRLAAIRNAAFYLRRRTSKTPLWEEDARVSTFFDVIASEAQRADELVGSSAAVATGPTEHARVSVALRRALDDLAPEIAPGVAVRVEVPDGLVASGSEEDLAIALRMLLENAHDAVGSAGEIALSARADDGSILLEVRDTGPGFGDIAAARTPLRSTKPGHLGLGLAIAERALRRMGGELAIQPAPRGACVALRVTRVIASDAPHARAHLLLLDDDEGNRLTLAALLEDEGYTVDTAESLAAARARLAEGARWDAALLDLHLDDGRGTDLVPALRSHAPEVVVLLLSGAPIDPRPPGVDATITKAVAFASIVAELARRGCTPR